MYIKFARHLSLRIKVGPLYVGGGRLKAPKNCGRRCFDVVVMVGEFYIINVNYNFIRVRKNLGPSVVLFNRVVCA